MRGFSGDRNSPECHVRENIFSDKHDHQGTIQSSLLNSLKVDSPSFSSNEDPECLHI
jgi:hypothetical protein